MTHLIKIVRQSHKHAKPLLLLYIYFPVRSHVWQANQSELLYTEWFLRMSGLSNTLCLENLRAKYAKVTKMSRKLTNTRWCTQCSPPREKCFTYCSCNLEMNCTCTVYRFPTATKTKICHCSFRSRSRSLNVTKLRHKTHHNWWIYGHVTFNLT